SRKKASQATQEKKARTPARFAPGAQVRVKPGTTDPDFPDIPLGGWAGTIQEVDQRSVPTTYLIGWDRRTLDELDGKATRCAGDAAGRQGHPAPRGAVSPPLSRKTCWRRWPGRLRFNPERDRTPERRIPCCVGGLSLRASSSCWSGACVLSRRRAPSGR